MKIKNICIIITLFLTPSFAIASESHKYKTGDCITPTDSKYSWYGKNARIEAISKIEGYEKINYILAFPSSISNSVIFSKSIEKNTKMVSKLKCNP